VDALVEAARDDGVRDERVLDAIAAVPRSEFVPVELAGPADVDMPIPIPHGQVTTQPSLVARMIEALSLDRDGRVLEIATGYGWQTALLARLAREVFSVERFDDIAEAARAALAGRENVHIVVGDGSEGLPDQAPFEAILVSAARLRLGRSLRSLRRRATAPRASVRSPPPPRSTRTRALIRPRAVPLVVIRGRLRSHSSQRGRYQFQSPSGFIEAGRRTAPHDRRVDHQGP
jgi:protein-L-isoaspartate(D-aspartate) O-methyltransferase